MFLNIFSANKLLYSVLQTYYVCEIKGPTFWSALFKNHSKTLIQDNRKVSSTIKSNFCGCFPKFETKHAVCLCCPVTTKKNALYLWHLLGMNWLSRTFVSLIPGSSGHELRKLIAICLCQNHDLCCSDPATPFSDACVPQTPDSVQHVIAVTSYYYY